jgi:hypothetical protein
MSRRGPTQRHTSRTYGVDVGSVDLSTLTGNVQISVGDAVVVADQVEGQNVTLRVPTTQKSQFVATFGSSV